MNFKITVLFAVALFFVVAEVSARVVPKEKGYDGCSCSERIVKSKDVKRYPLKLPLECHRPGDTCRCRKVKVTPAHLPRPKHYVTVEKEESCGHYVKAPKYMHDFSEVEDYSAEEEYVKMPVDVVSMNIAQELQRKIETKATEEALSYGFRTIPADRPSQKYRINVPEGDLHAYEKTIVELQPYKVSLDSDEDTFAHDVKQTVNTLSYQDVGYLPVKGKSPKFVKKTCVVDDGSHESVELVKKVVQKKVHPKKVFYEDEESEEIYKSPKKVHDYEESEEVKKVVPSKKYVEDSYEVKKYPESYESSEEKYVSKKVPVSKGGYRKIVGHDSNESYEESDFYTKDAGSEYDIGTDGYMDQRANNDNQNPAHVFKGKF